MGTLRLLLAISVIAAHSGALFGTTMLPGIYAVETFFVISGFYMSLVLSSKYSKHGSLLMFYINRLIRLYPTFFLVTVGAWAWFFFVCWWLERVPDYEWIEPYRQMGLIPKLSLIVSNWTMIGSDLRCLFHYGSESGFLLFHNYGVKPASDGARWVGSYGTIVQAWSVGVEIWFYLAAPWLARLRVRYLLMVGCLSLALKVWMETSGLFSYFFFPAQLVFFVIGMFTQQMWSKIKPSSPMTGVGWGMVAMLSGAILWFPFFEFSGKRWAFYAFTVVAIPFVFNATKGNKIDGWLGRLSYPIYMVHMLVMDVVYAVFDGVFFSYLTLLLTLCISVLMVRFVEEPLDRWRQRRVEMSKTPIVEPMENVASLKVTKRQGWFGALGR